jgi:hypothetical protein
MTTHHLGSAFGFLLQCYAARRGGLRDNVQTTLEQPALCKGLESEAMILKTVETICLMCGIMLRP